MVRVWIPLPVNGDVPSPNPNCSTKRNNHSNGLNFLSNGSNLRLNRSNLDMNGLNFLSKWFVLGAGQKLHYVIVVLCMRRLVQIGCYKLSYYANQASTMPLM